MSVALAGAAIGLLGSLHCVGMCGGIAGALSAAAPRRGAGGEVAMRSLAYNTGRVASYTAAGALAGGFGAALAGLGGPTGTLVLRGLAAALIVAAGLYVGGWSTFVTRLESLGASMWRRVSPLTRRLGPMGSVPTAFALGALWGWLPCGLVYSALAVAAASGSALDGALTMAAFGAGTLPVMLAMGLAAGRGTSLLRTPVARRFAGAMVVAFGVWTFAAAAGASQRLAASAASGEAVPSCHSAGQDPAAGGSIP